MDGANKCNEFSSTGKCRFRNASLDVFYNVYHSDESGNFHRYNLSKATVLSVLSWNLKESLLESKFYFSLI